MEVDEESLEEANRRMRNLSLEDGQPELSQTFRDFCNVQVQVKSSDGTQVVHCFWWQAEGLRHEDLQGLWNQGTKVAKSGLAFKVDGTPYSY